VRDVRSWLIGVPSFKFRDGCFPAGESLDKGKKGKLKAFPSSFVIVSGK
jgi:hypothetical protein